MKATEQYFPLVLFIMLYKVVLTFESVDEILECDHSNQEFRVFLKEFVICPITLYRFYVHLNRFFSSDLYQKNLCRKLSLNFSFCATMYY